MRATHANEKNKTLFGPSQPPLQTKLKQKFASSIRWMWLTHVSEKNKITFEPS
jgi:hypothetical protein